MSGDLINSILTQLKDTFFAQYGRPLSYFDIKKNVAIPFKEHPQFPVLADILSRKDNHHAALHTHFSEKLYVPFLEALLQHLAQANIPQQLRGAELLYLDISPATISQLKPKSIEKDLQTLMNALATTDKYFLIVLANIDLLLRLQPLAALLTQQKCRVLLFTDATTLLRQQECKHVFTAININNPTDEDVLTILKQQRTELENYHHILIPEEILTQAYILSERYISTTNTLEKALLLLDSSAARASAIEMNDNNNQFKPILTNAILCQVLANWTQIPASQLQLHKFKLSEFVQGMQQRVFGQDTAITLISEELQKAHTHLENHSGPFCSLLFAGPKHAGKKTTALATIEQLFKQLNIIYFLHFIPSTLTSIADIKVQRYSDKAYLPLKDVITQTPHAVLVIENLEKIPAIIMDGLQEIIATGFLYDTSGQQYNFRQAIIIMNANIHSTQLNLLAKTTAVNDFDETSDLLQLVMNEKNKECHADYQHYAPHELIEECLPELRTYLPAGLLQHLHIIPFLPLAKSALEKIIRLKLKILGKQLDSRYNIELGYAPEVIRYLAHEVTHKQQTNPQDAMDTDKALQPLYFCVEQAILNQSDNKNRSNQLFLQLNETGQTLRSDWITLSSAVNQHAQ